MKNIHILPTENSSRISYSKDGVLELHRLQWRKGTQNMYITSDEEIKKEDWVYNLKYSNVRKIFLSVNGINSIQKEDRKIILTTDQDLIKDGVQAIDDEFLEWFVDKANDSGKPIDIVEVEEVYFNGSSYYDTNQLSELEKKLYSYLKEYKIIIPKEESKLTNTINKDELGIPKGSLTELIGVNKQETLEEVTEKWLDKYSDKFDIVKSSQLPFCFHNRNELNELIEDVIKWQQEQNENTADYIDRHIVEAMVEVAKQKMYSEEEVYIMIGKAIKENGYKQLNFFDESYYNDILVDWFEKYKKK